MEGADAGLHVVIWFNELPKPSETVLLETARRAGIGVHGISPLYVPQPDGATADRLGLVMGYSALTPRQIERGVQLLLPAVETVKQQI
ncbi:hypothetical protein AJ87_11110 [Rhizobium yanglingense]|nr:hypothetical protein AJ87_11110 [Rhizobium yanglingense]